MKKIILLVFLGILLFNCKKNKTELIILGTVHKPIKSFEPDSLYNILLKIKPDLILFEVDSSFFTKEFNFIKTWGSNENIATIKYMKNFKVDVRPYEFTGRNEYRKKIGARPTDSKALKVLDSLYKNDQLDSVSKQTYGHFLNLNDTLNSFAFQGAKAFNNSKSDKISEARQRYKYKELLKIMEKYPIFSKTYFIKSNNDSISYLKGYKKASEFWDLRNQTMAKNILHFVKEYKGSRIVVLNGYYHRYYLNHLIKPKQDNLRFIIKEFYDY